jgi:hypothetical protein
VPHGLLGLTILRRRSALSRQRIHALKRRWLSLARSRDSILVQSFQRFASHATDVVARNHLQSLWDKHSSRPEALSRYVLAVATGETSPCSMAPASVVAAWLRLAEAAIDVPLGSMHGLEPLILGGGSECRKSPAEAAVEVAGEVAGEVTGEVLKGTTAGFGNSPDQQESHGFVSLSPQESEEPSVWLDMIWRFGTVGVRWEMSFQRTLTPWEWAVALVVCTALSAACVVWVMWPQLSVTWERMLAPVHGLLNASFGSNVQSSSKSPVQALLSATANDADSPTQSPETSGAPPSSTTSSSTSPESIATDEASPVTAESRQKKARARGKRGSGKKASSESPPTPNKPEESPAVAKEEELVLVEEMGETAAPVDDAATAPSPTTEKAIDPPQELEAASPGEENQEEAVPPEMEGTPCSAENQEEAAKEAAPQEMEGTPCSAENPDVAPTDDDLVVAESTGVDAEPAGDPEPSTILHSSPWSEEEEEAAVVEVPRAFKSVAKEMDQLLRLSAQRRGVPLTRPVLNPKLAKKDIFKRATGPRAPLEVVGKGADLPMDQPTGEPFRSKLQVSTLEPTPHPDAARTSPSPTSSATRSREGRSRRRAGVDQITQLHSSGAELKIGTIGILSGHYYVFQQGQMGLGWYLLTPQPSTTEGFPADTEPGTPRSDATRAMSNTLIIDPEGAHPPDLPVSSSFDSHASSNHSGSQRGGLASRSPSFAGELPRTRSRKNSGARGRQAPRGLHHGMHSWPTVAASTHTGVPSTPTGPLGSPSALSGSAGSPSSMPPPPETMAPWAHALRTQVEFYFSDGNLAADEYLRSCMTPEGLVKLSVIAKFPRIRSITTDVRALLAAVKASPFLEVFEHVSQDPNIALVRGRYSWFKFSPAAAPPLPTG